MVLDCLRVVVDVFEVVVDGLGGFRSFHVLVPTHHSINMDLFSFKYVSLASIIVASSHHPFTEKA